MKETISPTATSNNPMSISDRPRPLKKKPHKILDAGNTFLAAHYTNTASTISADSFLVESSRSCTFSKMSALVIIPPRNQDNATLHFERIFFKNFQRFLHHSFLWVTKLVRQVI
ncbi:MAG: hypothetical protein ACOYL3_20950 [Desulfuromonadaceae bacterium]